jgi:hypothetical protein
MGEVISSSANLGLIEEHVRRTARAAGARGGEAKKAADLRFPAVLSAIDAAAAARKDAMAAEATAMATVMAEDGRSDNAILTLKNTMWGALDRPRRSAEMDQVFPGGAVIYTSASPARQSMMMQLLSARIMSVQSPRWTAEMRTAWTTEIDALRASFEAALAAHRPTEAAAVLAEAGYRTAVLNAHGMLKAFKRDLRTLGMSEAQIHEIIPDAAASPAAGSRKKPGDGDGGNGTTGGNPSTPPAPTGTEGTGKAAA